MKIATTKILFLGGLLASSTPCHGYTVPYPTKSPSVPSQNVRPAETTSTSMMMSAEDTQDPTTFREAEVLGLRLMQEGNFKEALVGRLGPDGSFRNDWHVMLTSLLLSFAFLALFDCLIFCLSFVQRFKKG